MSKTGAQRTSTTTPARQTETRAKDPAGSAGAPGAVGTILRLQQSAGNRAVSDLIGAGEAGGRRGPEGTCPVCGRKGHGRCPGCGQAFAAPQQATAAPTSQATAAAALPALSPGEEQSSPAFRDHVSRSLGSGRLLDGSVRRTLESSYRHDFGGVRIHTDDSAAQAADAIGARAFTLGNSIWFGRGQYRPETRGGRHLLAHELAHTIQQRGQPPTLQPSLLIGGVADTAEVAADRAADAVLGGRRVPHLGASQPVVRRVPRVSRTNNPDERIVELDDGTRYRVTRVSRVKVVSPDDPGAPKMAPRISKDRVWVELKWCQGTKGTISLGANAPEQLRDLVARLGKTINNGGTTQEVLKDLKDTTITPFVGFDIARSGAWQVSSEFTLTVGKDGVTGGTGSLRVGKDEVDVDVTGKGSSEGGASVGVNVTVTPGKKTNKFKCPEAKARLEQTYEYQCRPIIPAHKETLKRKAPKTDTRTRYIYFVYAEDTIDSKQSASEAAGLQSDLAEGFRVSNITAFTSPEGPMAAVPGFRGNEQLARDRAAAAKAYIEKHGTVPEGQSPFVGDKDVIDPSRRPPDPDAPKAECPGPNCPELYTIIHPAPKGDVEGKGTELETHAVGEFEEKKEEERHRTPELEEAIKRQRTPAGKAKLVYPLLRRAVITLTHAYEVEEPYEETVPEHDADKDVPCPPEVREAAEKDFQVQDIVK